MTSPDRRPLHFAAIADEADYAFWEGLSQDLIEELEDAWEVEGAWCRAIRLLVEVHPTKVDAHAAWVALARAFGPRDIAHDDFLICAAGVVDAWTVEAAAVRDGD